MKYLLLILALTWGVNGYAQNNIIGDADKKDFIVSALDKLDIEGVTVMIRPMPEDHDTYGRKILAKATYSKDYPNVYIIYLSNNAKKTLIAHELIHIWQAYNGEPCNKNVISCEREADDKKGIVL